MGLKVSRPWWGHSASCSPLWTMFLTFDNVHHEWGSGHCRGLGCPASTFLCSREGKSPSGHFTLEITSLVSGNWKAASCPLSILKGFCAWGYGGPCATSDPRRPLGQSVGVGTSMIGRCEDLRESQRPNCTKAATLEHSYLHTRQSLGQHKLHAIMFWRWSWKFSAQMSQT